MRSTNGYYGNTSAFASRQTKSFWSSPFSEVLRQQVASFLQTSGAKIQAPTLRVMQSMTPEDGTETSVTDYQPTPHDIPQK